MTAPVDVLAVIGKPLRKIVRVLRYADSIYGSQHVELECGHEVSASSRASGKARCHYCQKEARAAIAELIAARDEDAAMPIYVELNWITDGNGEDGSKWWPRRRQELADQGYTMTGEGSNGAEFFMRGGMTERLVAALARVGGGK